MIQANSLDSPLYRRPTTPPATVLTFSDQTAQPILPALHNRPVSRELQRIAVADEVKAPRSHVLRGLTLRSVAHYEYQGLTGRYPIGNLLDKAVPVACSLHGEVQFRRLVQAEVVRQFPIEVRRCRGSLPKLHARKHIVPIQNGSAKRRS